MCPQNSSSAPESDCMHHAKLCNTKRRPSPQLRIIRIEENEDNGLEIASIAMNTRSVPDHNQVTDFPVLTYTDLFSEPSILSPLSKDEI